MTHINTSSAAELRVLLQDLDSDQPDTARHAIDLTVCDPFGCPFLTDVRKALSSPSAGPGIGEALKWVLFVAKITQAQLLRPDWVPEFAFHPIGFDLNAGRDPSVQRILDLTVALYSQSTTEP
jgi:hypothetical protein